ncbi:MAG: hypothetical protein ABI895_14305, partial [Deltaproteobacteria bacterium]
AKISKQRRWLTSAAPSFPSEVGPEVANMALRVNGRERSVPWQSLDLATAAQVCRVAQLVCSHADFDVTLLRVPTLVAWIWLPKSIQLATIRRRVAALASDLLQVGMDAVGDTWLPVGCIPAIDMRETADGATAARVYSEKVDAAGKDVVETAARAIATPLARLAECEEPVRVQLELLQLERVRARCRIDARELSPQHRLRSLGHDRHDPAVAAAHNARVLETLLQAASAMGIDAGPWALEARQYAARWGSCEPLANWQATRHEIIGELQLPMDFESVFASLSGRSAPADEAQKRHWTADVVTQTACIGLASSLAHWCAEHSNETDRRSRKNLPPPPPSRSAREAREPKAQSRSGVHSLQYIVGRSLAN